MSASTLEIHHYSTFRWEFTFTDENDEPFDLTGHQLRAQVRKHADSAAVIVDLTTYLTITDAEAGAVEIVIPDDETPDIQAGNFKWGMVIELPGGEVYPLIDNEDAIVHKSIPRP